MFAVCLLHRVNTLLLIGKIVLAGPNRPGERREVWKFPWVRQRLEGPAKGRHR